MNINKTKMTFFDIPLFDSNICGHLVLIKIDDEAFENIDTFDCLTDYKSWFSAKELSRAHSITHPLRKTQFFLGRIATKFAFYKKKEKFNIEASIKFNPKSIEIINSDSGAPAIFANNFATNYNASISHAKNIIASLIFKKNFPCGIDVEFIDISKIAALKKAIQQNEIVGLPFDAKILTVAWTLKESLSKALQLGLSVPFEEFEISSLENLYQSRIFFKCTFKKYPNLTGICRLKNDMALSIVFPQL